MTPATHVHPEVIEVMRELDIDLSERTPQLPDPAGRPIETVREIRDEIGRRARVAYGARLIAGVERTQSLATKV